MVLAVLGCILIFTMHISIIEIISFFARNNREILSLGMGFPFFFNTSSIVEELHSKPIICTGGAVFAYRACPKIIFPAPPPPKESPNISHWACQILLQKKFRFLGGPFTFLVVRFFGGGGGARLHIIFGQALYFIMISPPSDRVHNVDTIRWRTDHQGSTDMLSHMGPRCTWRLLPVPPFRRQSLNRVVVANHPVHVVPQECIAIIRSVGPVLEKRIARRQTVSVVRSSGTRNIDTPDGFFRKLFTNRRRCRNSPGEREQYIGHGRRSNRAGEN